MSNFLLFGPFPHLVLTYVIKFTQSRLFHLHPPPTLYIWVCFLINFTDVNILSRPRSWSPAAIVRSVDCHLGGVVCVQKERKGSLNCEALFKGGRWCTWIVERSDCTYFRCFLIFFSGHLKRHRWGQGDAVLVIDWHIWPRSGPSLSHVILIY